jgi:hypothetical protein
MSLTDTPRPPSTATPAPTPVLTPAPTSPIAAYTPHLIIDLVGDGLCRTDDGYAEIEMRVDNIGRSEASNLQLFSAVSEGVIIDDVRTTAGDSVRRTDANAFRMDIGALPAGGSVRTIVRVRIDDAAPQPLSVITRVASSASADAGEIRSLHCTRQGAPIAATAAIILPETGFNFHQADVTSTPADVRVTR